jgi:2-methylcitrate synthase
MPSTKVHEGLVGVVVDESAVSVVDGERSTLIYRGYTIEDLAEHSTFDEVAWLIWFGRLPTADELDETSRQTAAHRSVSAELQDVLGHMPPTSPPMSVLRTAVSLMGVLDPRAESNSAHLNQDIAVELCARMPSVVAVFHRQRTGQPVVNSDPGMTQAGNFLYMLQDKRPSDMFEHVFDVCLILHMDHGFNASTFSGRVTASTLSDIYSAVTSAIGTLRGPLHGGANTAVMRMLLDIEKPDKAEAYIKNLLKQKQKVMGFGHRVYREGDPRAHILRRWCRQLGESTGQSQWADMSAKIEEIMEAEKGLVCNVDFYSASVYYMLGIPMDLYTAIFAMSRVVGWTAHLLEQYANNKLIRPMHKYTGPKRLKYKPIEKRTVE